ncbi:DUF2334 domain-containing protein [Terribacillus sp. 7520-G]|uniref:DUF2334 domain-containing protein n=1 Tax=Terribacillus sp. 7520-G TaxID=2025389 RepID=UPI000BA5DF65|nr:DUF2334 domain-containing protein [Terribacillus sp. 7520-G]PAD40397.1 hypothetical protein CHH53_00135 [Terribacillus sp. 7520-G]
MTFIIRLDDASEYMDVHKWNKIEALLDKYEIKPIVGVIPNNEDETFTTKYVRDDNFWLKAKGWQEKGWEIALHGYNHVYASNSGGINPVNHRSEFAGLSLEDQQIKISKGMKIFKEKDIISRMFFAPSHTFDDNTLKALTLESNIRMISDTIANNCYKYNDFYFIPQQSGKARLLPLKLVTFCYHPNEMTNSDFNHLESFIVKHRRKFISIDDITFLERKMGIYDIVLRKLYFTLRKIKRMGKG